MKIEVVKVEESQKSVLRQMLELYEYEFSEFNGNDINEYGFFGYRYFDHYWTEPERYVFPLLSMRDRDIPVKASRKKTWYQVCPHGSILGP